MPAVTSPGCRPSHRSGARVRTPSVARRTRSVSRCRGLQVHREDRQLVVTCDDALIHGSWRRGGDAAEVSLLRSGLSRCDVLGSDQAGRHPNSTSALSVPLCRGCHLRDLSAVNVALATFNTVLTTFNIGLSTVQQRATENI